MIKQVYHNIKLFSNKYFCPICIGYWDEWLENGFNFDILLKVNIIGGGKRKHLCPNCSSSDRLRMIYSYLYSQTNLFAKNNSNVKLLHIAPERQLLDIFTKDKNIEYYPCDKYNYNELIKEADITKLHFTDNMFDFVICNHVLEHIEDDVMAMSELHRVLKKNGIGILQIPYSTSITKSIEDSSVTSEEEKEQKFGQNDHVRIYSKNDYTKRLKSVGLSVKTINPFEAKFKFNPSKLGLNPKEELFIVTK